MNYGLRVIILDFVHMSTPLIEKLKKEIEGFKADIKAENIGHVLSVGDGVARIDGLSQVMAGEMIEFETTRTHTNENTNTRERIFGLVLNLEEDNVGVVVLGDYTKLKEGDIAKSTGKILQVPVGEAMLGRVVNALGVPLDGRGAVAATTHYPV